MCDDFFDVDSETVEVDDVPSDTGDDTDIDFDEFDDVDSDTGDDTDIEFDDTWDTDDIDPGNDIDLDNLPEIDDTDFDFENDIESDELPDIEESDPESMEEAPEEETEGGKTIDEFNLLKTGNDLINRNLEAMEDNYRDQGLDAEEIRDRLADDRWKMQQEYLNDAFPGQDVSPNVFNGFSDNGAKERLRDLERIQNKNETEEVEPGYYDDAVPDEFREFATNGNETEEAAPGYYDDAVSEEFREFDANGNETEEAVPGYYDDAVPEEFREFDADGNETEEAVSGYYDDAVPEEFREFDTTGAETEEADPGYYDDAVPDEFRDLLGATSGTEDINPDYGDETSFSAEDSNIFDDGNELVGTSSVETNEVPSIDPHMNPDDTQVTPPDDIRSENQLNGAKERDEFDLLKTGNDVINRRLEAIEDDYKDKGFSDEEIQDQLAADCWNIQQEYLGDAFPGQDVPPNVFNGFSENGSRDRLSELEQSEKLQETIARETYNERIEKSDYERLSEDDNALSFEASDITFAAEQPNEVEQMNPETDYIDKTESAEIETVPSKETAIIKDDSFDDIEHLQPTATETDNVSSFELSLNDIEEHYKSATEANDTQEMEKYRTLHELLTLQDELELTDGDPDIPQLGGIHKNVRGKIEGFESHHIPAQSVQDVNANELPTIAITEDDHRLTDSYRGKSNRKYKPFLPDGSDSRISYKNEAEALIEDGNYVDLVRDEVYNIRDRFGHKYDGAIKQYLSAMAKMIDEKGVPKKK